MSKDTRTRTSRTRAFEVTEPMDISKLKYKLCPICLGEDVDIRAERTDLVVSEQHRPVKFMLPVVDCRACGRNSQAIEAYAYIHDATCMALGIPVPAEIRKIRKKHKLTAAGLARLLRVDTSLVKEWESRYTYPVERDGFLLKLLDEVGAEAFRKVNGSKPRLVRIRSKTGPRARVKESVSEIASGAPSPERGRKRKSGKGQAGKRTGEKVSQERIRASRASSGQSQPA